MGYRTVTSRELTSPVLLPYCRTISKVIGLNSSTRESVRDERDEAPVDGAPQKPNVATRKAQIFQRVQIPDVGQWTHRPYREVRLIQLDARGRSLCLCDLLH